MATKTCVYHPDREAGYLGYEDDDDGSQIEVDICAECYHA